MAYIYDHALWRPQNAAEEFELLTEDVPQLRVNGTLAGGLLRHVRPPRSLRQLSHPEIEALRKKLPPCVRPEMRGR